MCTIVFPSASKTARARSTSAASPPTMIESRASIAPISPPETGASSVLKPFAAARSAMSRDATGEMLLMSTTSSPSCVPSAMPAGPNVTASTSGAFVTIVTTMSERSATSRGVVTTVAPRSFSESARASVRLVTVRGKPALRAFRAIGRPMIPRPTKPTRGLVRSVAIRLRLVALDVHGAYAFVGRDEVGVGVGLADIHRREEPLVGHVHEGARALELVRDRFRQRGLFEAVLHELLRPFDHPEELVWSEAIGMGDEHGGTDVVVAFVDLVEVHRRLAA